MSTKSASVDIVRAGGLVGLETLVQELGGNFAESVAAFGLKPSDFTDPDRFVRYSNAVIAIETMARELGVRDFGLRLSTMQNLEFYGLLWLVMKSAPTVRDGMLLGIKHVNFHVPAQGYRHFRSVDGRLECVEMFQRMQDLPDLPQTAEHAVGHLHRIVVELSGNSVRPSEIHFRHRQISNDDQYERYFGVIPHFESDFDGVAISQNGFRKPIESQSPLLQQFVERFLAGVTPRRGQTTAQEVAALLHNLVRANMAELSTVASILGQHPRTLQRRLDAEGAGFEALRDNARKEWAQQLLSQRDLTLAQIGDMLGYSDQSVLTRACQRWFGATPKTLRRNPALALDLGDRQFGAGQVEAHAAAARVPSGRSG